LDKALDFVALSELLHTMRKYILARSPEY